MEFMPSILKDPLIWFAVIGALLIKISNDVKLTLSKLIITIFSGIFSAVVFGPALIDYFNVSGKSMSFVILALTVMTGEHIMRLIIGLASNPDRAIELWKKIRGEQFIQQEQPIDKEEK
jgi:hypothetical protein